MAKSGKNSETVNTSTSIKKSSGANEDCTKSLVIVPTIKEEDRSKTCQHISKAVDLGSIKKQIIVHDLPLKCITCSTKAVTDELKPKSNDISLCMKCGVSCCNIHVSDHFQTPHSDPHVLFVNFEDWNVQCLNCNTAITVESCGKLKEAVSFLRNQQSKSKSSKKFVKLGTQSAVSYLRNPDMSSTSSASTSLAVTIGSKPVLNVLTPRGLRNLGNTCFFNSVLQCLGRTPFLLESLLELKDSREQVTLQIDNNSPICVTLPGNWGATTEILASTMMHLTLQSGDAYSPAHLLDSLRKKHNQFMGYNQHDAHELLRTLLDCVKTEDIRRYQAEILRYYGVKNANPENPKEHERKLALAKGLCKRLTEIVNIRPDPIFRGITVSANQCTLCKHKSEIPESFLDLSLPVSFMRLQPLTISRKKNDVGEKCISKHQLKKAAKKNRKMAKMKRKSDAIFKTIDKNKQFENSVIEMKDIGESGCSSVKASSPIQNIDQYLSTETDKYEILAEAMNEINGSSSNGITEDSGIKLDNSFSSQSFDTLSGNITTQDNFLINNTESKTTNDMVQECLPVLDEIKQSDTVEMSDENSSYRAINSLNLPTINNLVGSSSEEDEENDEDDDDDDIENSADYEESEDANYLEDTYEIETRGLCTTLQTPIVEDEENSILACLREYTKCELLTENNTVNCEKCTKDHQKKTGEKKLIYRVFTKQLLIKSPPPVLILHLKRFETRGAFSFRKVDTFISFPFILDIGSFCSGTCEKLLYPEQKNIIYSLYGIVEHSGSLNAGHYVAYIKVRKMPDRNSYRNFFLPTGMSNVNPTFSEADLKHILPEHKNEEYQWYHISDSSVRPIAEEDVLRKQAYLLFYERIW